MAAILTAVAQPQGLKPLSFDVASVKTDKSQDPHRIGVQFLPGGRFTATNVPLFVLAAVAYNVSFQNSRLTGGPDWIRADRFRIEARAEPDALPLGTPTKFRDEKIRLMLQALLADRFKLIVRREVKDQPVWAMVVGKHGPKLEKSKIEEKDCADLPTGFGQMRCHGLSGGQGSGLHGTAVDMADVALFVANWTDRPVVDRTGIEGLFDIQTEGWTSMLPRQRVPEGEGVNDPTRPTLFMVFDKLGLKLEQQKAPVEMFTIEHVERPSEN